MSEVVQVIGGGLAGCEAAWQLARRGVRVRLYEMRPLRSSPAHTSDALAELVCSNSLRSDQRGNAIGLLHEELRRLGSLVLEAADATRVPAGKALAVDRTGFAGWITGRIESEPRIELVREEVHSLPDPVAIVATGPLTSDALAQSIADLCGGSLYFYDAISPIVYRDSLDDKQIFRASRYDEGDGDYLNLPLDQAQYLAFVEELCRAETVPLQRFEAALYFEGCLPIEVMAQRGPNTLAYGPMKPVGLVDPRTGERPHAVIQLRQEDKTGGLFNLVGFQTRMRIGEQKRVLRGLPGMQQAVFARFGSAHRNTFIRAPSQLGPELDHVDRPGLYFAGQIAGVEGYVESAALGLLTGIHAARRVRGESVCAPPRASALGSLVSYLTEARPKGFQPMNVNYGLFPPLEGGGRRVPKQDRNRQMSERALSELEAYTAQVAGRESRLA
ncbi:MAG: methylenetetrahydrofolate--tRNA-(uracil(54)-C(5))-methyltransferase (FADH(2)-oxidizing) TrmFO [Myxococcales bacterium]|nr:methylenetetrahydrofolate--tRNA-(uracil(54)-C(5))-methyltransferase (FADH(2)-oxidizing) TrmFO [Myxococcales bacterium]